MSATSTSLAADLPRYRLVDARIVTPDRVLPRGWLEVADGRIVAVRTGAAPQDDVPVVDLAGAWLLPGLIDLHCHGGGGASFSTSDPEEVRAAAAFHLRHGTTRVMASLVTSRVGDLAASVAAIGSVAGQGPSAFGHVLGAHLEGPFLSPRRPGCHDTDLLLAPDTAVVDSLLQAAPGTVRTLTLAPEVPGATALIRHLLDRGVIPALGHSDADYEDALTAFDEGVPLVTHLHNAMGELNHREPGIPGAFYADDRVTAELIVDGIHVHPEVVRLSFSAAPGRIALVTDAAPAAGTPEGTPSRVGHVPVVAWQGRVTLPDRTTLAGSALTMDQALRRTLDAGVGILAAAQAAATTPARVLGLQDETGSLRPGLSADLVVLGPALDVLAVACAGVLQDVSGTLLPSLALRA